MVDVNYLAILAAAVVSMIIGSLWYGPLFGKVWMRLSGVTMESIDKAKARSMGKTYLLAFIGSLVTACVLSRFISSGISVVFLLWLGFIAPIYLASVLWEGKPWKLWLLNNAYYLVTLLAMALVLRAWA